MMVALVHNFPETADIETSSEDYARRFSGSVGDWFLKVQEEATLRMLGPHSGATVLDVGGGHGQIASAMVRKGYRVTVFGSADVCRMRIQHLLKENRCSFQSGNILQLPYANSAFDLVVSYRLLSHVSRWPQFLSELARVARVAVMIDYPAIRSINFIAPQLFQIKKRLEGNTRIFNAFSESQLLEHFELHGFKRAERYAQFFLPMVLHRLMRSGTISHGLETAFRFIGATPLFGSPVILKLLREAVDS